MARKFPVNSTSNSSFDIRKFQEGKTFSFFFEKIYTNETISTAAITTLVTQMGKIYVIDKITIQSNSATPIAVVAQILNGANNTDATINNGIGTRSSDSTQIDLRGFTSLGDPFVYEPANGFRMYDKTTLNIGTRSTGVTNYSGILYINIYGTLYDADLNWDADYTILGVGDSILSALNGGTGYYDDMIYFTRIRNYYKLNKTIDSTFYPGQNVRKINRAEGGRTSSNAESWRRDGYYDISNVDICVYNMMVNDAGTSPISQGTRDTFKANLETFINWFQSRYPGSNLIICSGSPQTNNTAEANLVLLRQDARDVVDELVGTKVEGSTLSIPNPLSLYVNTSQGKVIYIDTGTAFDRTDVQFYNNSQGNGDGVHPNAIRGHAAIFNNCIKPALDAWNPKL